MISLYIHIPFCVEKCNYCSFFVIPNKNNNIAKLKDEYLNSLKNEINFWSESLIDKQIKTIYIGGGTPFEIGKKNIFDLINYIDEKFDLSYLEEISIELNPNPYNKILDFVKEFNEIYGKKFFRIRFSLGLQTFDDEILLKSKRGYVYNTLIGFLRDLQKLKKPNNVFNFDFIAFGTKWKGYKYDFFEKFIKSYFADSFSLYTLELFPGSMWYNFKTGFNFEDKNIYEEFNYLKRVITQAGYKRYEISNFALPGKESIHNLVYWNMEDYIGLGMNASSFIGKGFKTNLKDKLVNKIKNYEDIFGNINDQVSGIRWTNTTSWKKYFSGEFIDENKIILLLEKDYKIEEFFLRLRVKEGIKNIYLFEDILINNWKYKLQEYANQKLVIFEDSKLKLTSKGMNVYNHIITNLLKEI